ncbi:MAG: hypothetical protein ACOYNI_04130 [Acidimicrobiia bacterium]
MRGCTLMPANSIFHADITGASVIPQSSAWTATIGGTLRAGYGGFWENTTFGIPVNFVPADRAKETVVFNRGYSSSGPGIDNRPYAIPDYPLVEGMPAAPAYDRHLLVLQEGTCIMQELINVANGVELPPAGLGDALANAVYASAFGSTWLAQGGVQYDLNSNAYFDDRGWADAAHLPMYPLKVRPDEVARGVIDHMIGAVIAADRGHGSVWPARAGDGTRPDASGVPMGSVLRLRADFDLSRFGPYAQTVLRALQVHGAVIHDSGPATEGLHITGVSNGWTDEAARATMQRELSTVPLSAFDIVDVTPMAASPATSWQVR